MWEKKQDKEKGNFFLIKHFASNIKKKQTKINVVVKQLPCKPGYFLEKT